MPPCIFMCIHTHACTYIEEGEERGKGDCANVSVFFPPVALMCMLSTVNQPCVLEFLNTISFKHFSCVLLMISFHGICTHLKVLLENY